MQAAVKTFRSSALISLLLIVPLMVMEVVNRRTLNESFPGFLFFVMWFNLFAVTVILLPVIRSLLAVRRGTPAGIPHRRSTLLTNPWSAALVSIALFLVPGIPFLFDKLGWLSTEMLFNGPNPEQAYIPGMIFTFILFSFPVAAGIVARGPVTTTLRAGGRLFAHPLNLLIVVFLSATFAVGLGSLIIDQWPCFMGVPMCD